MADTSKTELPVIAQLPASNGAPPVTVVGNTPPVVAWVDASTGGVTQMPTTSAPPATNPAAPDWQPAAGA